MSKTTKDKDSLRGQLRAMKDGETIAFECSNAYEMESKRVAACQTAKFENCKFSCRAVGMTLSITRYNDENKIY